MRLKLHVIMTFTQYCVSRTMIIMISRHNYLYRTRYDYYSKAQQSIELYIIANLTHKYVFTTTRSNDFNS